ncbi:unnamed protein product [Ilex paraguariensis]|uniref:Uncharacterized protein n=1 Tax=Ilex paraguariensis TaxID=185542 RepID=A0ABC8RW99_9AQUA
MKIATGQLGRSQSIIELCSGISSTVKSCTSWFLSPFKKPETSEPPSLSISDSTVIQNQPQSPTYGASSNREINQTVPELPEETLDISISIVDTPSETAEAASPLRVMVSTTKEALRVRTRQYQILHNIREQELGKTVLGFVMPMTTTLLSVYTKDSLMLPIHLILLSLCIGMAALWNGMLLRDTYPKIASIIEQLGIACILFAFFGVVGSFLPPTIVWAVWLCYALTLFPLLLSHLPARENSSELIVP